MALLITITNAGRAEMIAAQNTGTEKVTITAVAFGTGQYTPNKAQTALQSEVKRVGTIAGQVVADDTIHVMAMDESSAAYNVGEFGLISDKGTLIAVYSQLPAAGWILQKAAPSTLLLATDIILESLDATVIEFGDITFINPPATVDTPGVVQLEHSLTNPSNARALTAGMGKKLQDEKEPNIAAGTTSQYWRGNKTWRDFATDVRAAVLTGLSTANNSAIAAADTVLAALGKLQAQVTGLATSKLDATANAVSASKLQTARTIGGVAFDGTANINLPGVNAAGNQSTSGNAATATKLDNARTISVSGAAEGFASFDGSSNVEVVTKTPKVSPATDPTSNFRADVFGGVDDKVKVLRPAGSDFLNFPRYSPCLVWSTADTHAFFSPTYNSPRIRVGAGSGAGITWEKDLAFTDSNITGNAATATKLQTARTINGVAFDGTANITIADPTKVPSAGGNLTGDLTYQNVAVGGWARGLTARIQSSGAYAAGIGFLGSGDSVSVAYLGIGATSWASGNGIRVTAAGVTISGATTFDTLITGSVNGNAGTATKLQTPRTIGGVAFDGTANINLPGVNAAGNQNTSGNAATATKLQTPRTIGGVAFDGTANINLPGVNAAGNQNTSGNAATATKLQTPRTINGVAFDGTVNIVIDGSPTGAVLSFAMANPPTGWLRANGAAVSRTTYAALFAVIGTTYGAGDGSNTFNLPDLRGEFVRGWDAERGVDNGRSMGSTQLDQIQNITGTVGFRDDDTNFMVSTATGAFFAGPNINAIAPGAVQVMHNGPRVASFDASLVARAGTETRPRNVALLYCIKY